MSVVAAFLLSGFLKAGTPFETASTPDSATAPEENARSSMKMPERLDLAGLGGLAFASSLRGRASESAPMSLTMKMRYEADADQRHQQHDVDVGRAGRTARRTPSRHGGWRASSPDTQNRHSGTAHCGRSPTAERMASTPPATDTATVRM